MPPSSLMGRRICMLRWISVGLLLQRSSLAWTVSSKSKVPMRPHIGLSYSLNCDDNDASCLLDSLEQELDPARKEEIRMNLVRTLQNSFYSSSSLNSEDTQDTSSSALNWSTNIVQNGGRIPQLPLFRVPWIEVIGRTNVLFIHEPMYTNMFEEILRAPSSPRWFGHLHRSAAEGSQNVLSPLQAWDTAPSEADEPFKPSHILGTLMNITDFRRMKDGQLLLLVQAMERFVVTNVHQTLPYGIATAQLLPDIEELQLRPDHGVAPTEAMVGSARTQALAKGLQTWWPYEFAGTPLPLPSDPRTPLAWSDVVGTALAQVVPFAALEPDRFPSTSSSDTWNSLEDDNSDEVVGQQSSPPLEVLLLERGILSEDNLGIPASLRQTDSIAELEVRLWLVLNDYFTKRRNSGASIPSHLLSWLPSSFRPGLLASIANVLERDGQLVSVHTDYPDLRRQKRLSYAAAQLLEGLEEDPEQGVPTLRQTLLQIPSTRLRLAYVVARWEQVWKRGTK